MFVQLNVVELINGKLVSSDFFLLKIISPPNLLKLSQEIFMSFRLAVFEINVIIWLTTDVMFFALIMELLVDALYTGERFA